MSTFPFPAQEHLIPVPTAFRVWFTKPNPNYPFPVPVKLLGDSVHLPGSSFRLTPLGPSSYAVLRGSHCVGEIDRHTVRRTVSDQLCRELGIVRAAIFGTKYPAPLAYELRGKILVHPGACFNAHEETIVLRTLFTIREEDARCSVCDEPFL